jgi:hypothetical protein
MVSVSTIGRFYLDQYPSIPDRETFMYQRILVPINGSSTSERALQEAIKLAEGKAQLH